MYTCIYIKRCTSTYPDRCPIQLRRRADEVLTTPDNLPSDLASAIDSLALLLPVTLSLALSLTPLRSLLAFSRFQSLSQNPPTPHSSGGGPTKCSLRPTTSPTTWHPRSTDRASSSGGTASAPLRLFSRQGARWVWVEVHPSHSNPCNLIPRPTTLNSGL